MTRRLIPLGAAAAALFGFAGMALAQDAAPADADSLQALTDQVALMAADTAFVFNTFSYLVTGAMVMFMAAGFAMLESGLVRSKNTATICLKNVVLYAISGIMYYLIGYNLMYVGVEENVGYIGEFLMFYDPAPAELAIIADGDNAAAATQALLLGGEFMDGDTAVAMDPAGNSKMSDWFFQMVFVATAASIVSGTVAERIKLWPFLIFTVVLTGIIYPIQGAWTWGTGWLNCAMTDSAGECIGFSDFAGSTIVHSVGGWAALVGALILGARKGKYNSDGTTTPMPGANLPLATLGTFILWLGWFGFNGGSELGLGSAAHSANMSIVFVNTNLAACGGVVAATVLSQLLYGKVDLTMALNGAIGGLVSITAGPALDFHLLSIIIGAIGGVLVVIAVPLLDKLKIDDVVGAIPAHLVCGIWGTLAVGIFGGGNLVAQVIGIIAVGVFTIIASAIVWIILKAVFGIRVSEEHEETGLDKVELGMEAYPEFRQS